MERSPIKGPSENDDTPIKDESVEFDEETLKGEVTLHSRLLILQKGFFTCTGLLKRRYKQAYAYVTTVKVIQHDNMIDHMFVCIKRKVTLGSTPIVIINIIIIIHLLSRSLPLCVATESYLLFRYLPNLSMIT